MLHRFRTWFRGRAGSPDRLHHGSADADPGTPAIPQPQLTVAESGPLVGEPPVELGVSTSPCVSPPLSWGPATRARVALAIVGFLAIAAVVAATALAPAPSAPPLGQTPQIPLGRIGSALLATGVILMVVGTALYREGYLAGIWLTISLVPWVQAIVTVIAYLLRSPNNPDIAGRLACVYIGVAASLAFVACAGFLGRAVSTRDRAQAHVYDELRDRRSQLRDRHTRLLQTRDEVPSTRLEQFDTLVREASSRLDAVERELCDCCTAEPALRWVRATGYSNILRTLHRVEEMILAAQPDHAVVGDALNDYLSLTNSTVVERDKLIVDLRAAVYVIAPDAARTFFNPAGPVTGAPEAKPTVVEAREVLREVRFAINNFRDSRVDRQIGTRNSLFLVIWAGAGCTYLALGLAVIAGVPTNTLIAVSAYFLVAAIAGLLNRLRIEAGRSTAVEDYGLSLARLVASRLLSGLAGIGGVYLVAKSPAFLSAIAPGAATKLSVSQIFDLQHNELGLLVAVLFGFTPALFFSSLQRQSERFQQELESSQPAGGSSLSTNTG
jgi:hypothetical protein